MLSMILLLMINWIKNKIMLKETTRIRILSHILPIIFYRTNLKQHKKDSQPTDITIFVEDFHESEQK